jgi:hypothetical protein
MEIEKKSVKLRKIKAKNYLEIEVQQLEIKYNHEKQLSLREFQRRGEVPIAKLQADKKLFVELEQKKKKLQKANAKINNK